MRPKNLLCSIPLYSLLNFPHMSSSVSIYQFVFPKDSFSSANIGKKISRFTFCLTILPLNVVPSCPFARVKCIQITRTDLSPFTSVPPNCLSLAVHAIVILPYCFRPNGNMFTIEGKSKEIDVSSLLF